MKTILILYFLYWMYKIIKSTPNRLNEEKYKKFMRESMDNVEVAMARFPAKYQDYLIAFAMAINTCFAFVHAVICIYTGMISYFQLVNVLCFMEAICTIYEFLAHWKEAWDMLSGKNSIVYHKHEERFCLGLSYVCYILVLVTLLAF